MVFKLVRNNRAAYTEKGAGCFCFVILEKPYNCISKMERFGQMKAEVEILLSLAHPESISLIKVTKNSKVCLQLYA